MPADDSVSRHTASDGKPNLHFNGSVLCRLCFGFVVDRGLLLPDTICISSHGRGIDRRSMFTSRPRSVRRDIKPLSALDLRFNRRQAIGMVPRTDKVGFAVLTLTCGRV